MIKKILVVDDSPVARKILRSCLPKDKDYEIEEGSNGQEGLEKFKEMQPDVMFLDLTMPVMGGMECLEKVMEIDPNAKVMIVTSDIQAESFKRVMDLGAFRLIKKPPSKEAIQKALNDVQGVIGE